MGSSCCDNHGEAPARQDDGYRRVLWVALTVNLAMFIGEIVASLLSASVSLRADALDFLGDAANYALALAVLGMALRWRAAAALVKGGVMAAFALWVAENTIRHAIAGTVPRAEIMGAVGLAALAANAMVAALLFRYRRGDSQALSVWLCARNDCFANLAVIAAGAGVWLSATPWPDIAVAAAIAWLGLYSAVRIARRALAEMRLPTAPMPAE